MDIIVKLCPEQIAKIIADYLRENGFVTHSQNVEFKVGSHVEGFGTGEYTVYDFTGCNVECVLDIPEEDTDDE